MVAHGWIYMLAKNIGNKYQQDCFFKRCFRELSKVKFLRFYVWKLFVKLVSNFQ